MRPQTVFSKNSATRSRVVDTFHSTPAHSNGATNGAATAKNKKNPEPVVEEPSFFDTKAARRAQRNLQTKLSPNRANALSATFGAFSDNTRLRILYLLSESELCVGDLATILEVTPSGVSHQLRGLRALRLVKARRDGRNSFYSVADDHVRSLLQVGLEHVREKKSS